jgi:hypothetical protein
MIRVVNFSSNPDEGFDKLRQLLPQGPLRCGEFHPGWFDTRGTPHNRSNTANYLRDLETMLNAGFTVVNPLGEVKLPPNRQAHNVSKINPADSRAGGHVPSFAPLRM